LEGVPHPRSLLKGGWLVSLYVGNVDGEQKERRWEERVKQEIEVRVARGETVTVDEMMRVKKT
jgi:hypothetical protein